MLIACVYLTEQWQSLILNDSNIFVLWLCCSEVQQHKFCRILQAIWLEFSFFCLYQHFLPEFLSFSCQSEYEEISQISSTSGLCLAEGEIPRWWDELIPLMRNEILDLSFSAGRPSFYFLLLRERSVPTTQRRNVVKKDCQDVVLMIINRQVAKTIILSGC